MPLFINLQLFLDGSDQCHEKGLVFPSNDTAVYIITDVTVCQPQSACKWQWHMSWQPASLVVPLIPCHWCSGNRKQQVSVCMFNRDVTIKMTNQRVIFRELFLQDKEKLRGENNQIYQRANVLSNPSLKTLCQFLNIIMFLTVFQTVSRMWMIIAFVG